MTNILVAVDDFVDRHRKAILAATSPWARVRFLPEHGDDDLYRQVLAESEIVVGWPDPAWLAGTPVRFLQIGSAGFDAYAGFGSESVRLCTARGVHSIGVAEHSIALMMALMRNIPGHFRDRERRVFRRIPPYGEVTGSVACIVGFGAIGRTLAARCRGLGMVTTAVDLHESLEDPVLDRYFPLPMLRTALGLADVVFLTLPGGEAARHLFDADLLAALKPGACLINGARGSLIDETALVEALREGRLRGAGLDVAEVEPLPPDSLLWELDNVLITGHCGGFATHMFDRFCNLVCDNLTRYHRGEPLKNQIDWSTECPRSLTPSASPA